MPGDWPSFQSLPLGTSTTYWPGSPLPEPLPQATKVSPQLRSSDQALSSSSIVCWAFVASVITCRCPLAHAPGFAADVSRARTAHASKVLDAHIVDTCSPLASGPDVTKASAPPRRSPMSYRFADMLGSTSFERTYATPPPVAAGSFAMSTAVVNGSRPATSRTMMRAPQPSGWSFVGYVIVHQAWTPSVVMTVTPGGGGPLSCLLYTSDA